MDEESNREERQPEASAARRSLSAAFPLIAEIGRLEIDLRGGLGGILQLGIQQQEARRDRRRARAN